MTSRVIPEIGPCAARDGVRPAWTPTMLRRAVSRRFAGMISIKKEVSAPCVI